MEIIFSMYNRVARKKKAMCVWRTYKKAAIVALELHDRNKIWT